MGKKKMRSKYVSKGQRVSMSPEITKAVARDVTVLDTMMNKLDAYNKGKRVWLTIPNPNPKETKARFIRVLARDVYGDPKKRNYIMPGTGEKEKDKKKEKKTE